MNNANNLKEYLTKLAAGGLCVAFSGGVDSAVLLKTACEVCDNVHAVTLYSDFHSPLEASEAEHLAKEYGANFKLINMVLPDEVMDNPTNRCYLCKNAIFTEIKKYAAENGLAYVLDGTNADDLNEYRPGLKALSELGVKSPLAELKLPKSEVRKIAAEIGITVASKPSAPCLATRIPYNTRIEPQVLAKIDEFENYIKTKGFAVVRARVHGDLIRIEVAKEKLEQLFAIRDDVAAKAKILGFLHVTIDLEGFRSGTYDTKL